MATTADFVQLLRINTTTGHSNLDSDYGPYTSVFDCLSNIKVTSVKGKITTRRGQGLTVGIYDMTLIGQDEQYTGDKYVIGEDYLNEVKYDTYNLLDAATNTTNTNTDLYKITGITEYWFKDGIEDSNLVPKFQISADDVYESVEDQIPDYIYGGGSGYTSKTETE